MSTSSKSRLSQEESLPVHQFSESPILIIDDEVQSQINFLHKKIGKKEWSGILLYSHEEGDISDADSLLLRAEQVFLMDIGTSSGTEYENDVDSILDMADRFPRFESGELKIGHIHSHHNMKAYFSNVDMDELQINSKAHNYYLSLIVNFAADPVAKISTVAEVQQRVVKHPGANEEVKKELPTEQVLGVYNVTVTEDLSQGFYDRYSLVKKKREEEKKRKKAKRKAKKGKPRGGRHYGYQTGYSPHGAYSGHNNGQRELGFQEPDMSDGMIDSFIYKWFNLSKNLNVQGDVEAAVDQIELMIDSNDGEMIEEYIEQLDHFYEDFAMSIIGNDLYLTDDEWLKITNNVIQKLEPHESNKVVKGVLNNLQTYKQILTQAIEEYEQS